MYYFLDNNVDLSTEENDETAVDEEMITDEKYKSPDQISSELITLSLLPESRWRSLLNLDVIKVRNEKVFINHHNHLLNTLTGGCHYSCVVNTVCF